MYSRLPCHHHNPNRKENANHAASLITAKIAQNSHAKMAMMFCATRSVVCKAAAALDGGIGVHYHTVSREQPIPQNCLAQIYYLVVTELACELLTVRLPGPQKTIISLIWA